MWELYQGKAECQRIDASELWCWRRLLRVPWTAKTSSQSTLREINPEYSLEGLRLKLKLQYFGNLIQRADSLAKTLMLGKIEGKQRRRWQRVRWLDSITDSMEMNFVWQTPTGRVSNRETWHAAAHGVAESDLTELINSTKFVKNWQIVKLRFDRKQQNAIQQLSFNWKINSFLKRDRELGEHKLDEMGALNMKKKKSTDNLSSKVAVPFCTPSAMRRVPVTQHPHKLLLVTVFRVVVILIEMQLYLSFLKFVIP